MLGKWQQALNDIPIGHFKTLKMLCLPSAFFSSQGVKNHPPFFRSHLSLLFFSYSNGSQEK